MKPYTLRPVLVGDRFFWAVSPKDGNDYKDPPTSNMDDSEHPTYGQLTLLKLFYVNLLNFGNSETKMYMDTMTKTEQGCVVYACKIQ